MFRLSVNEVTTYRWTFEEDVAHYMAAGIPAIGVWRQKLSDFGEDEGIDLLAESGLEVSNLIWAGGFTGSDGRTFQESVDDALEAIRTAARLRAGCLVVYSGARGGHTMNHAQRLLRWALEALAPAAADHGVTLALEPMHPGCAADFTFLTGLRPTLDLLDELAHPALRLVFDTYHLGFDPAACALLPAIVDRIAVVHLGDGREAPAGEQNRRRLGQGTLPLREIIRVLSRAGYSGYYDVELIGEEIEAHDYQDVLRHARLFGEQCADLQAA